MSASVDDTGLRRKRANLKRLTESLTFLVQDAAAYFKRKLIDEIINGAYVGVISGNLRRSWAVTPVSSTTAALELAQVAPAAPYADHVANWARGMYGKDYLELVAFFYGDDMGRLAVKWWNGAIRAINAGNKFSYQNPFPG